ncbi:hypothetical protein AC578_8815 [Pseudocercospora eumusae]|uniref:Uncharacterized protein n=1 Tax=Pseudocercospora eumusae TaxID=321146 RepID=A0A139GVL7_9PEZI|nr:hypothetical protein AC578_8815 [Pseudocercospora eumusae]
MTVLYQSAFPLPPEESQEFPGVTVPNETVAAMLPPLSQAELDEQQLRTLLQPPHPELDQAIDGGDAARVKDELANCRRRFHPDAHLNTAMARAVACGRTDIVAVLMDNNVPVNTEDLEAAARYGHISVLAHLMKHFSWPIDKVSDHGLTVLSLAVEHRDTVLWLLSEGASVNEEDGFSETALSRAVQFGTEDVVWVLLEAGADVSRGAPLHASLLRKGGNTNLELMKELLELGAPVNKFLGEGSSIWEAAGFKQMTALHVACDGSHRNLAAVRLLLAHGANPTLNKRLHGVELPNTSAFDSARGRGYKDIVSVIQEQVSRSDGNG